MSYTKYFPRDTRVMAQVYDDYEERKNKAHQVLDFEPLAKIIPASESRTTTLELLAEAVAIELNIAYNKGSYDYKNRPKELN